MCRSRESAKPITKSKAQSPVSNTTARQSALPETELTTPPPQPASQPTSRQPDSRPPELAAEEPVAKTGVDLDFNLASPVKKPRSNLTHKPATPERLRKFASLPHMPFTPERLPQRKRPRPTGDPSDQAAHQVRGQYFATRVVFITRLSLAIESTGQTAYL